MSKHDKIVQIQTTRKPARFRGVLSSSEYNDFQDSVHQDLVNLGTSSNTLFNNLINLSKDLYAENQYLKQHLLALRDKLDYNEITLAKQGSKISRTVNFHDITGIVYPSTLEDSKRAVVKSQFGEIYLPANGIENKFYSFSLRNNSIVLPDNLTVDVANTFDKVDGNGLKNYEYNGMVENGEVINAFNSIDESVWLRKVIFPLESKVEEVEVQLTAVVPSSISPQANLIEVVPFPEGSIDITHLSTASDLGSTFQEIDNFEEENNITAKRYHFSPRNVEQIRIRLRCRNWIELGGKKVFIYGLRELGLKLVDYNKTVVNTSTFGKAITSIVKINAPRDNVFNYLHRIDVFPNFFAEDASLRHVYLKLSTTPDFTGVFWDSTQNVLPQDGISTGVYMNGASTIYAIFILKFVDSSGGIGSPYPVGTTPTVKSLGLTFTAVAG